MRKMVGPKNWKPCFVLRGELGGAKQIRTGFMGAGHLKIVYKIQN